MPAGWGERDELLVGFAYANIKYDHGRSHAPTGIVGYRRYLWKRTHIEYLPVPLQYVAGVLPAYWPMRAF